ncbi:CUB and zona pellucida-like domain-containing protein 1, partial [Biomphalaria glabrata]
KTHGDTCSTSVSRMCMTNLFCRLDRFYVYRCLCASYAYVYLDSCLSDNNLIASVSSDSLIATSFMFLKLNSSAQVTLTYNVSWTSRLNATDRGYNMTSSRDVYAAPLTPATDYTLTIASILPADNYYQSKSYQNSYYMATRRLYDNTCSSTSQCDERLECVNGKCGCQSHSFYNTATQTCQNSLSHGQTCSPSVPRMCQAHLNCRLDRYNINRCLCSTIAHFYLGSCLLDTNLIVYDSSDSLVKPKFMYLKMNNSAQISVMYNVSWISVLNASDKGYNTTSSRDVYLSPLTPATDYNITIASTLPSDSYYFVKFIRNTILKATKSSYGYLCTMTILCEKGLDCVNGLCGCLSDFYYNEPSKSCQKKLHYGYDCNATKECQDSLSCTGGRRCKCLTGQYYHTNNRSCYSFKLYGMQCDATIRDMCKNPDFVCTSDAHGLSRCLCSFNTFYDGFTCSQNLVSEMELSINQVNLTFHKAFGLRSFNLSWSATGNSHDYGSQFINGNLISIQKLTPGQQYIFTVATSLTSESEYENNKTLQSRFSLVTYPASPGKLWLERSQLNKSPYILKFNQSQGVVNSYQVTIKTVNLMHEVIIRRVTNPEVITFDLYPNTQYIYEIIAYNMLGNQSAATTGNFMITAADDDEGNSSKDFLTPLIVLVSIGWVIALAACVTILIVCLKIRRRKPKLGLSPKDSTASELSATRSTRGRSRSIIFEDVMVNDYNSFPQNVQLETVNNNEDNTSQIAKEDTDPPNNSVYVNACIKPNILASNNIYDVIGDINPALRLNTN